MTSPEPSFDEESITTFEAADLAQAPNFLRKMLGMVSRAGSSPPPSYESLGIFSDVPGAAGLAYARQIEAAPKHKRSRRKHTRGIETYPRATLVVESAEVPGIVNAEALTAEYRAAKKKRDEQSI